MDGCAPGFNPGSLTFRSEPRAEYPGTMRSRSVLVGLVLFAVGVLTALLVLSRLVFPDAPVVPILWFLAMLTGLGFAVLLLWLWVQSRRRRRAVRSAVADPRSANPI